MGSLGTQFGLLQSGFQRDLGLRSLERSEYMKFNAAGLPGAVEPDVCL